MTLVPDYSRFQAEAETTETVYPRKSPVFWACKRVFDLVFTTVLLLPATGLVALFLLFANRRYNPGPLFYWQKRMGRDCQPFKAVKFRTMDVRPRQGRGPDDPVETDRITPLGQFLRRTRFDELPQILNVYRGDMSLIGPRPDYFRHALHFKRHIPAYRDRHMVRPGISGLAQIELGYIEGTDATRAKTAADIAYIKGAGFRMDTWILFQTVKTVVGRRGT